MSKKQVVRIKAGEARIVSTRRWMELVRRLSEGEVSAQQASGACEEACEDHDGVESCGNTYAFCGDGTTWLLDP